VKAKPFTVNGIEYPSQAQAAKALGVDPSTLSERMKGKTLRPTDAPKRERVSKDVTQQLRIQRSLQSRRTRKALQAIRGEER
jgi:DNA-binding transcriptional regulator YdaS (Cro superfamily)